METQPLSPQDLVSSRYEPRLEAARQQFENSPGYRNATTPGGDPDLLNLFLIRFCALGAQMTRPVGPWIARAGQRCVELGWADLGNALLRHATHEDGHDQLMVDDTRALVTRWNQERPESPLDADALLGTEPSPGVVRYCQLHEDSIAGDAPYRQLAIEYEIEGLSVRCGPVLMIAIADACGPEVVGQLTFLPDHIAVDQGHTVFNRKQLNGFLDEFPTTDDQLVDAGTEALESYGQFVDDCWRWARDRCDG